MKTLNIKLFTLVEVAIAVGILAIGATAVVTLMPTGIKEKKDAIGENYAGIFTGDAKAYFANLSEKDFSALADLPEYSDLFSQNNSAQPVITEAVKQDKVSTDIYDTNVPGVYIISKSTSSTEDYSAQLVVWQSIPPGMNSNILKKPGTAQAPPEEPSAFNITSGTVTNTSNANVKFKAIGSEWPDNVYFRVKIKEPGKNEYTIYPFGQNVPVESTSGEFDLSNLPAGTTFVSEAYGTLGGTSYSSLSTNTSKVHTLKNGSPLPTDAPYYGQKSNATLVQPYLDDDGENIAIANDQIIYLFDVDGIVKDYQDLVILTNIDPVPTDSIKTSVTGIGISPTNNDYAFELSSDTGVILDRNMMKNISKGNNPDEAQYIAPNSKTFSANTLKMKTKNGDNATLNVGNQDIIIDGKNIKINSKTANALSVKIWKNNSGMGQWQIQILPSIGSIDDGTTDPIVTPTPNPDSSSNISTGIGVNAELSWPLSQMDYSKRQKLRFYNEYYNMSEISK